MTIFAARYTALPVSLLPVFLSPYAVAESDQTLIVSATPQSVSELDTPAAVSVVDGEDMRLATPRINLSESLTSVPTQYQSIPMAPQLKPSHAGGVITLQCHYQGIDNRWTHRGELGIPVTFTTGLNY